MVQWLRLGTATAGAVGLMPNWGNKIPHATWPKKKEKKGEMREEERGRKILVNLLCPGGILRKMERGSAGQGRTLYV